MKIKFPRKSGKRVRGPGNGEQEDMVERITKLQGTETVLDDLVAPKANTGAKRRRLQVKHSEDATSDRRKVQVTYRHTREWRGRRHVDGAVGAQAMDQRLQKPLLAGTHDLDASNFIFTILPQMLDRLELETPEQWAPELDTLRELKDDSDKFIQEIRDIRQTP